MVLGCIDGYPELRSELLGSKAIPDQNENGEFVRGERWHRLRSRRRFAFKRGGFGADHGVCSAMRSRLRSSTHCDSTLTTKHLDLTSHVIGWYRVRGSSATVRSVGGHYEPRRIGSPSLHFRPGKGADGAYVAGGRKGESEHSEAERKLANRCVDCGRIIGPRSTRCRTHAAAHARSRWRPQPDEV